MAWLRPRVDNGLEVIERFDVPIDDPPRPLQPGEVMFYGQCWALTLTIESESWRNRLAAAITDFDRRALENRK